MNATVTDPVCGMTIDPAKAVGSSAYSGQTYHFCSRGCETKFDAAPATYAAAGVSPEPAACCFPAATIACCATSQSCC